ncbi:hypothetical protein lerEdw1_003558 [Lerista edwardsae]|nr:hypothetical protein lerEdw1_003558 [Lerista edwardsae]
MAALGRAFPGAAPAAEFLPTPGRGLLGARDPATPPGSPRAAAAPGLAQQQQQQQPPRGSPPRAPPSCRHKHKLKMEEATADGCPARKRRLTAALATGLEDWTLPVASPIGQGLGLQPAAPCAPGTLELPCEDMEQVMGEQPCEAARQRFQELEDRIIDEEDEEEDTVPVDGSAGRLPTLVLSDTLKRGLERDYDRVLTKKIVESMSRPSMELVLWKPLPDFLLDKSKPVPAKSYKPAADGCYARPASLLHAAFPPPPEEAAEPLPAEMPSGLHGAAVPTAGAEEEMEL